MSVGCNETECGAGTHEVDGRCVIATDAGPDATVEDAQVDKDTGTGTETGTTVTCSSETRLVDGKCLAKKQIGSACTDSAECLSGTCVTGADNVPGGLCTMLGCSADNACPNGSTCYQLDKSTSLCMPYCDRNATCRTDEGYHCQPLYTTSLNICAPSCTLTKSCSAGTRCNEDSGLCEIAECTVGESSSACSDEETCWPDSKNLSSKGGLCLHLCEVAHPEKNCNVGKDEVCQPLENDPTKGFCAPPVCTKNAECPAGAECTNHVCQPPAACTDNAACGDDRTCVSGKCLRKCPTDDSKCSDVHPDLVCATPLPVPACLPLGSFPGSACKKTEDNRCGDLTVGSSKVGMVCENETCLADCTVGGDTLCTGLSSTLQCAHGIFSKDLCLPKGSFPGSTCGANNSCAADLNGDPNVDMQCVSGTCVVGCSESGKWSGYGDALCSLVDSSLTCADKAGSICVRACGDQASCATGYSCFDPGAVHEHDNACLPTGSFPGSPCRSTSGNECDSNVGGNDAVDMVCTNNTCTVSCPGNNDALCAGVDSRLTCSESAGNLCVFACGAQGACPGGYSCLDPGDSTHQNACLPTGSFPGSPCRSDNSCDQDLGGNAAVDMACVAGSCVVGCNTGNETVNDQLCGGVSSALTCSETGGHLCLPKCQSGVCGTGFSCLSPTGENACLPNGTFPGSTCRTSGTQCDQDLGGNTSVDMVCANNVCAVNCNLGSNETINDAVCAGVNSALTCAESGGHLCVVACVSGQCGTGFSCFDSLGENACLPNGTFPGSACRSTVGDECNQNLLGNPNLDLGCLQGTCLLSCPNDTNAICSGFSSSLTCASAVNFCFEACTGGVGGTCDPGFVCTSDGACVPGP